MTSRQNARHHCWLWTVSMMMEPGGAHADAVRRNRLVLSSDSSRCPAAVHRLVARAAAAHAFTEHLRQRTSTWATVPVLVRWLGFGAELCNHSRRVDAVNAALRFSDEELRMARRILESAESDGVSVVDVATIDAPVIAHANRYSRTAAEESFADPRLRTLAVRRLRIAAKLPAAFDDSGELGVVSSSS
jgi:hypothetical protein